MADLHFGLATAGMVLFLLGLLNGFIVGFSRSPRMSLSAHLTAVQSATFLIVVALLWPHVAKPEPLGEWTALALWLSFYALWIALLIAGLFGAGRDLPIAGGGARSRPAYQYASTVLLYASMIVMTSAVGLIGYWMVAAL